MSWRKASRVQPALRMHSKHLQRHNKQIMLQYVITHMLSNIINVERLKLMRQVGLLLRPWKFNLPITIIKYMLIYSTTSHVFVFDCSLTVSRSTCHMVRRTNSIICNVSRVTNLTLSIGSTSFPSAIEYSYLCNISYSLIISNKHFQHEPSTITISKMIIYGFIDLLIDDNCRHNNRGGTFSITQAAIYDSITIIPEICNPRISQLS